MRIVVLGALLVGVSAGFAQQIVDPAGPDGNLPKQPASVRGCIDNDGDGYSIGDSCGIGVQLDCDDTNAAIHPGAAELCDGRDNNCNNVVDEGYAIGNACTVGVGACERTGLTVCDPAPPQTNVVCNVVPGTPSSEVCNGLDDNCDGVVDEGVKSTFYQDADADGHGNAAASTLACSAPSGFVSTSDDCNDALASVHPGAVEACNGVDDDCNGSTDETFPTLGQACSAGVGACLAAGVQVCNAAHDATECNAVAGLPQAETCNGADDNCDGSIDEGVKTTFYQDLDGDGHGNPAVSTEACAAPPQYVLTHDDCNDASAAVHPGAAEICNGIDDNCSGATDEGFDVGVACTSGLGACLASGHKVCTAAHDATVCDAVAGSSSPESCNGIDDDCDGVVDNGVKTTFYQDSDGDGYGNLAAPLDACTLPAGHVTNHGDCDDTRAAVNPEAAEVCGNALDDNCNAFVDESDRYADGSGIDTANDCTDALHPCRSIVKAVAQACAGGTVHVGPGTYAGQVHVAKPLTLEGAQHGNPGVAGRAGTESTVVGDLEGGVIEVDSSDVTVDGFEVVGGGSAFSGFQFFDNGTGAFSGITFKNNLVHAMRAPNPYSSSHGSYGLLAGTGSPGARGTISGLSITGNSFYDIGVPGSVPGRGAYVYTVVGGSPGAGATITGNTFAAIYPKDAATVGTGITVDVATEVPVTPCSGVKIEGNTFSSVAAAASLFATASSFVQPHASFSGVSVYVVNAGPRATVDEAVLPPFARTDRLLNTSHTDAYFAKVSDAVAFTDVPGHPGGGDPRGTVFVSAGTFTEQVVINKPLELFGAGKTVSTIKAPATLATENIALSVNPWSVTTSSIVRVEGGGSAIPVELHDLAISGPGPSGCGSIGYGLFALGGAVVNVHDAAVVDLRDEPLSGCQNGVAIRAGMQLASPPSFATLTVTNTDFSTYQKGGVVVDGSGSTGTVTNSHFVGVGPVIIAQNGIQFSRGATGTISGNTITDHVCSPILNPTNCGEGKSYSAGILLYAVGAVSVSGNPNIDRNDMAIYATAPGAVVTMSGNHIASSTYEGLVLGQGTMNVSDHQITGGLIGVDLYSSTGDANDAVLNLTHSVITGAAQEGIAVGDDTGDLVHPLLTAHNNHIFGNAAGLVNDSGTADATGCNWWGAPTGPNTPGANSYSPVPSAPSTWLLAADFGVDTDADGYTSCTADAGGDCNVASAAIHPHATETCDGVDSDCNGQPDNLDASAIASCDDGAFCTVGDTCNGTACTNAARDCGDSNGCTTDNCNETLDACTHAPDCNGTGHVYYAAHGGATDGPDLARPLGGFVLDVTGDFTASTTTSSVPGHLGEYSVAVAGSVTLTPRVRLVSCTAPSGSDDFDNVNSQDAVAIARAAVGLDTLTPFQFQLADVSASVPPRVSSFDASLVAQKSVNCAGLVFPVATASHSDWAFLPASFTDSVTASPGPTHDFIAALWGDVDEFNPSALAPPTPAPPHTPVVVTPSTGAELYVASGPRRVGSEWVVVLGLARADGILGLDITMGYDPRAVVLKSVRTTGIAARMSLVSNDQPGEAKVGVFGIDPLVGTGDFLVLSFEATGSPAGLPFDVHVDANEGQIPVSFGPGTVKPVNPATRGAGLAVGR